MSLSLEQVLAQAYGLGDAALTHMGRGAVNQNYLAEAGGRRYVLKSYAVRSYTPEEIRRSQAAQVHAGRAGIPVPTILPNLAGDAVTEIPGGFVVLSEHIAGRHHDRPNMPATAARSMGEMLGQIHLALAEIQPVPPYAIPDPAERRTYLERLLREAERRRHESREDEACCQTLSHNLAALERLAHLAPRFAGLPVQWVHGDYQDTNVIFDEHDRVAAVIDFDNFKVRLRANELMRAMAFSFPDGADERYAFFAGYVAALPLPEEEVALLAPLWCYLEATRTWPIENRYLNPDAYQARWDRFLQPPTGWWERNMEAVTDQLLAIAANAKHPHR